MPEEGTYNESGEPILDFDALQAQARAERDAALAARAEAQAQQAQEQPAEPVLDVQEMPVDAIVPEGAERQRDEKGRFAAAQPTVPAGYEDVVERYGGLDKALEAVRHQEGMIGRLGNELGELRKMVEEKVVAPLNDDSPYIEEGVFQRLVDQDPRRALTEAVQAGHMPGSPMYELALTAWAEEDQFGALRTDQQIREEIRQYELRQQIQALQAPIQQQTVERQFQDAYRAAAAEIPDLDDLSAQMMRAAQEVPAFQMAAANAKTPDDHRRLISDLATYARGMRIPQQAAAEQAEAEALDEEARRQRDQGQVVSAAVQSAAQPPMTQQERQAQRILEGALEWQGNTNSGLVRGTPG